MEGIGLIFLSVPCKQAPWVASRYHAASSASSCCGPIMFMNAGWTLAFIMSFCQLCCAARAESGNQAYGKESWAWQVHVVGTSPLQPGIPSRGLVLGRAAGTPQSGHGDLA